MIKYSKGCLATQIAWGCVILGLMDGPIESWTGGNGPRGGGNRLQAQEPFPSPFQDSAAPAEFPVAAESPGSNQSRPQVNEPEIRFNFAGASWKEVIQWFADQASLSLQADQMPAGTINFQDPTRSYSVTEGLDVLNRLLLDRGFSLVRRGRMLLLIDLEMENASAFLSEVAELVLPEDLDSRGRSDIVRCLFPLGSMSPDDAKVELEQLKGPAGRVIVLDSARQVIVTETVDKLLAIRELLRNATEAQSSVQEILLKHRAADEILEVARPLLDLEPGMNVNDEIRISVGLYGDRIYATGAPLKLSLLKSFIERADTPMQTTSDTGTAEVSVPVLRTHTVASADSSTVFDVLQTLLAGTPDARIAIDPKTKSIIASARPETQELITKTITELEGSRSDFAIIDLKRLEPSQALLTINKFFGVSEAGGDGPVVDGDPVTGRLWIRGTSQQIELVKNLINQLEGENSLGEMSDRIRILPYSGRPAEEALQQIETLWPIMGLPNQIRTMTPSARSTGTGGIPERRRYERDLPPANETIRQENAPLAPVRPNTDNEALRENARDSENYRFVTEPVVPGTVAEPASAPDVSETGQADDAIASSTNAVANVTGPTDELAAQGGPILRAKSASGSDIMIQLSPSGMIVASEDTQALDTFETLMQSISQQTMSQSSLPTIFWLKYAKADVAAELITTVLGGAESALDSVGSTIGGSLGGGMIGGLLGMMGGSGGGDSESTAKSVLTATGSVSIVPDQRLNALIIQAGPADLQFIELLLEKIDQQESPENIETVAKPALIPVIYQNANDVANIVKAVFAEKIGGNEGGGGGRQQQQPSPQDFINALRGGGGGRGGGGREAPKSEPTKIVVAVDTRSNSLVVTATPQDYERVRELVETLDQEGMDSEESVEVVTLGGGIKPEIVKQALESVLGTQTKSTSGSSSSNSSSSGGGSAPSSPGGENTSSDEIQRRIDFFRQMRERGGFGGSSSPFGGSPFGGRGGDSGGRGGDSGGRGGSPFGGRGGR